MYKQTVLVFSLMMGWISTSLLSTSHASTETTSRIDVSLSPGATVTIAYDIRFSQKRHKLMIAKADIVYTYNLDAKRTSETFPLQSGGGSYDITLLEQVSGTTYRRLDTVSVELPASKADQVFLSSVQNVNWQASPKATSLAAKLTSGKKTDRAKAQAILDYVTANIRYEAEEAAIAYLPSADDTLSSGKGMCYDYASLMAVMLRSSGVPTKLVMGSTTYVTEYHAWNEIYLDGEWGIVDATVDAAYKQAGKSMPFAKESSMYTSQKIY